MPKVTHQVGLVHLLDCPDDHIYNVQKRSTELVFRSKSTYLLPVGWFVGFRLSLFNFAKNSSAGAASYDYGAEKMRLMPRLFACSRLSLAL